MDGSIFSRSSATMIRPRGAMVPNNDCRHASLAAVRSAPANTAGEMPHAAHTSRVACSASCTRPAGGFAPRRLGCQFARLEPGVTTSW